MSYTAPPPGYSAPKGYAAIPTSDEAAAPAASASASRAAADPFASDAPRQEGDNDPDDFKFGVCVSDSSPEIRQMFLKKVYGILFTQILATTLIGFAMSRPTVTTWLQSNQWAFILPLFGSMGIMIALYFKRHSHPTNLVLLGAFTACEGFSLGAVCAYMSERVVLQALVLTTFVFVGLTLVVFVTDLDYSKMGPWLTAGLFILLGAGLVQLFLPFSQTYDLVMGIGGCVIFSGYVLYDTHVIMNRLSSEEWVWAVISLYLDLINLFISILRVLNGTNNDN